MTRRNPAACRRALLLAPLALGGLAGLVFLALQAGTPPAPAQAAAGGIAVPESAAAGGRAAAPAASSGPVGGATAAAFEQWMQQHSVLRGTALDGDWGLDPSGRVRPSLALRRRFDHLLQLQGQAALPQLGDWLAQRAARELPEADAREVMAVWQAYLGLLASAGPVPRPDDRAALAAAMDAERQRRRDWLGAAWAEAFFGAEEAAWRERQANGPAAAGPLIDRAALPPDAAQRLAEEEAAQARWQQRLAAARGELQRLRIAPELSAPQREEAVRRLLSERFAAGGEQLRARALLGLPPG